MIDEAPKETESLKKKREHTDNLHENTRIQPQ